MTTTKPQVKIVNCQTNEEIVRDATADEIAQSKIDATNLKALKAEAEAKAQAKSAILKKLGITAEEAVLLLL
jgi:hypothetical protein